MKISLNNPLLGVHASIAGGIQNALLEGNQLGCTAIQMFSRNNRQWSFDLFKQSEIQAFETTWKETSIVAVDIHANYLINVGSPKKEVAEKSMKALGVELQRCDQLRVPYLVLHPGSSLGMPQEHCIEQVARNIDTVLKKTPGKCTLLIENLAGQGSNIGYTFEQLAQLRNLMTEKKRVGFCLDTCHAFAAGYQFNTPKTYAAMWDEFDKEIGLQHLKVIHMNDSKESLDSHVDRHANIGEGKIGLEAFRLIMNDARFVTVPKILETPKKNGLESYIRNLKLLRSLIKQ